MASRLSDVERLRIATGTMHQTEIARMLGVSPRTIGRYLKGITPIPRERHQDVMLAYALHKDLLVEQKRATPTVEVLSKYLPIKVERKVLKDTQSGREYLSTVRTIDIRRIGHYDPSSDIFTFDETLLVSILVDVWDSFRARSENFNASITYRVAREDRYSDSDDGFRATSQVPGDIKAQVKGGAYGERAPDFFVNWVFDKLDERLSRENVREFLHLRIYPSLGAQGYKQRVQERKERGLPLYRKAAFERDWLDVAKADLASGAMTRKPRRKPRRKTAKKRR